MRVRFPPRAPNKKFPEGNFLFGAREEPTIWLREEIGVLLL